MVSEVEKCQPSAVPAGKASYSEHTAQDGTRSHSSDAPAGPSVALLLCSHGLSTGPAHIHNISSGPTNHTDTHTQRERSGILVHSVLNYFVNEFLIIKIQTSETRPTFRKVN